MIKSDESERRVERVNTVDEMFASTKTRVGENTHEKNGTGTHGRKPVIFVE